MKSDPIDAQGGTSPTWRLDQIVAELRTSREVTHNVRHLGRIRELPSRKALLGILDGLCAVLFPTHYGRTDLNEGNIDYFVGNQLHLTLSELQDQVRKGLLFMSDSRDAQENRLTQTAVDVTANFAAQLPAIRALLFSDLQAAYRGDPAATNPSEILLYYPGMTAIIYYRLAHELHRWGAPLLVRLISDIAHSNTGIDIHPGASIDESFFIDHGTGVVIGETSRIGKHCVLYQGVGLVASSSASAAWRYSPSM